ncbi:MAG: hypothetical protein Kow0090_04800 [Myxococcota bacterium]
MAYVFTPGLKVTERTVVKKLRRLPIQGEVLVKKGDYVSDRTVVARTELPGKVFPINVAAALGVSPSEISKYMLLREGEECKREQVIAQTKGFLGYFRNEATSPIDGFLESISRVSGQVMLRELPVKVMVDAYIEGVVEEVIAGEGVIIRTNATFIQGIFGLGGEVKGEIKLVVNNPNEPLSADKIDSTCRDKIVVGGSRVEFEAYRRAAELGVKGIVSGGFNFADIPRVLGYELGVAVTGNEEIPTTLIITEGFGEVAMAKQTFDLLSKNTGKRASMNGATQIRAGVQRPEVVIPLPPETDVYFSGDLNGKGIEVGSRIRAIRHPYFGKLGFVRSLPPELIDIDTETKVRVLEAEFDDGVTAVVPRANIEAIETE